MKHYAITLGLLLTWFGGITFASTQLHANDDSEIYLFAYYCASDKKCKERVLYGAERSSKLAALTKLDALNYLQILPDDQYTGLDNDKVGMQLAWSHDGFHWENVGGGASLLKSDFGSWDPEKQLRVPFIMQVPDGCWLCLWTLAMETSRISKEPQPNFAQNPIIWADVPDISIVRVDDTYYMSSTTMHMNPGVPIMKSKNLVDWDIVSYAYDILADTDGLSLRNGKSEYGFGTWASSIRHHDGMFVLSTFARSTGKTHIYTTKDIENEPWKETTFSPMLHDHTLFFDDDGKVYMLYGAADLRLIELETDLSGVKPGGFNDVVIPNAWKICSDRRCLFEGSQMFKYDGKYYLSNIAWPHGKVRTQTIYRADKITGPYEGRVILQDRGIAQGSLIDTPDGRWYAYLFQDSGAVGRIPYIVPVRWEDGWPVLGEDGKAPMTLDIVKQVPGIGNIVCNDEFDRDHSVLEKLKSKQKNENDYFRDAFAPAWQWNHNPDNRFWSLDARPGWLRLTSGRTDRSLPEARNMLTQRTFGPRSEALTFIDVTGMKNGDSAGLTTFQKVYGFVGVKMDGGKTSVVAVRTDKNGVPAEDELVPIDTKQVHLKISCDFENLRDEATFYWSLDGTDWKKIGGTLKMEYTIPHFMGYRFGLFHFATKTAGGYVDFDYYRIGDPACK